MLLCAGLCPEILRFLFFSMLIFCVGLHGEEEKCATLVDDPEGHPAVEISRCADNRGSYCGIFGDALAVQHFGHARKCSHARWVAHMSPGGLRLMSTADNSDTDFAKTGTRATSMFLKEVRILYVNSLPFSHCATAVHDGCKLLFEPRSVAFKYHRRPRS